MKPLFIIGAQRSGTTFLFDALSLHNKVIPVKKSKEPKTFLKEEFPKNLNEYLSLYNLNQSNESKLVLEKTTSYYENSFVASRIKSCLPQSKIIFIARDPLQRMISNYEFSKKNKLEKLAFKEAILNEERAFSTSVNPYSYITRSLYSRYLVFWTSLFKENLKVVLFEEMILSNTNLFSEIFSWAGVDPTKETLEKISEVGIRNAAPRSKEYDLGNEGDNIKALFNKEKKFLEIFLNRSIDCWSF